MIESNPSHSAIDRRSFERLINFTDAVAAIAITLQLLPLIDIKAKDGETVLSLFQSNLSQIFAFVVSFLVVLILWLKHNQVFNVMKRFDGKIFWLNAVWLILIVFLPWPTASMEPSMMRKAPVAEELDSFIGGPWPPSVRWVG